MSLEELKEYYNDRAIELLKQDNGLYDFTIETRDYNKIDKLLTITELNGFWDKVRNFTKKVYNDHSISRWQGLAELRYAQLLLQQEN